jgi:predicted MFS family arabinose efflux permease
MAVLWPYSTTLAPLVAFSIINGAASGGFFSLMPTVAGQIFGSARVALALGMLVSGWSFGYLLVSFMKESQV